MALNLVLDICLIEPIKVLILAFTFATLCRPPASKSASVSEHEESLTKLPKKKKIEFVPFKEGEIPVHPKSGSLFTALVERANFKTTNNS